MKFLPQRRTTDVELRALAEKEAATAKTPAERAKAEELVRMIDHDIMPPWIKRTGKKRG